MSCNSSRISTRMKGWSPWFPPSKPVNKDLTQNWSNFFFLFIILQFLHGFCSVHIVLFLNKMKLTRGVNVNMKGIMCYYLRQLWPRENKDGRLSNQNSLFFIGGGGVCKEVNINMSNKTKSLSEGEKIDFDAKWHNSVAASVGDKLKTTCTIFYCYKKLYATVIRLCQWTTNACWIFKSELKVKTS